MPFKYHAEHRHHIPKPRYRVTNWAEYDASSTLSRRGKTLEVPPPRRTATGPLHLLVDSTGLKLGGAGEWLIEKHGQSRRRSWRKLHIGVDANSGEIVAVEVTGERHRRCRDG